jgi:hypothetical protein
MEAIYFSEASVDAQWTTRRYIPEDGTLQDYPYSLTQLDIFGYFDPPANRVSYRVGNSSDSYAGVPKIGYQPQGRLS